MNIICKIFGHKWRCYDGFQSYCKRCGIIYTELNKQIKEQKNE